jgi:probable blue pigment (indigoidine) exporter
MQINVVIKKHIFIFLAIIFWGLSYPVSKITLEYMSPTILTFIRFFIGGSIIFLISRKIIYGKKELINSLLNVALVILLLNIGIALTLNPAFASVMIYTQPVFVVLIEIIYYKRKVGLNEIFGMITAFIGVLIVVGSISFDLGSLIALLAGFIWAIGTIYHNTNFKNADLIALHSFMSLISALIVSLFIPFDYYFAEKYEGIAYAILLTLIAQVFGYLSWFYSIKEIGPIRSGIFSLLVPVAAYLFSYLILGLHASFFTILGSSMVLIGIFLLFIKRK